MSFGSKHAKSTVSFTFDYKQVSHYTSLADLYAENGASKVYVIRGLYINTKGKYGAQPVITIDDAFVNVPSHLLHAVSDMLSDPEDIQAINEGKAGFRIRTYLSKSKNLCYSVDWVDVQ